jgi:hypothetical protein
LVLITQYLGHIDCLQVKFKDDFVLFNDLMKSITILRYNVDEAKFEEVKNKNFLLYLNDHFRLLMMFNHNGPQHVNFSMMIHTYVQKMVEI